MEENEVESGLWLAAGPSPASLPSSSPALTQQNPPQAQPHQERLATL